MSAAHLLIDGAIAEFRLDNPGKLNAVERFRVQRHQYASGASRASSRAIDSGASLVPRMR